MYSKLFILVLWLALLPGVMVWAQSQNAPQQDQQALKKELIVYHQQKVAPYLLAKRQELESKLPVSDRKEVQQVREELAINRATQIASLQNMKKERKTTRQPISEAQKQEIKALHTQYKQLLDRLEMVAKRNEKAISAIAIQAKIEHDKWQADLQAIVAKHRTQDNLGHKQQRELPLARRRNHWSSTRFLLIDPARPDSAFEILELDDADNDSPQEKALLQNANPKFGSVAVSASK